MLRKRFGKVWERLNQGKRELKGLMGKIRKKEERKTKQFLDSSQTIEANKKWLKQMKSK